MKKVITLLILFLAPALLTAEEVYTWVDKSGVKHYSTESGAKNIPGAQSEQLPTIQRENLSAKLERLKKMTPVTCQSYGGIDCTQGADSDGSVICLDGFRGSAESWAQLCSRAKLDKGALQLASSASGDRAERLRDIELGASVRGKYLFLTLRNTSGVKAQDVAVTLRSLHYGLFELQGPTTIEPYGIADYSFPVRFISDTASVHLLRKTTVKVSCRNCS